MTRIAAVALAMLAIGCQKENPDFCLTHPGVDGCPLGDGDPDGPPMMCDTTCANPAQFECVDHVCVSKCFGPGKFEICLDKLPAAGALTLPSTIDTADAGMCDGAPMWPNVTTAPDVCVIAAASITIDQKVDVQGARPLVLVGTTDITIAAAGELDAASHIGGKAGPNASPADCVAGTPPQNIGNFGGGGGGGSFVDLGGGGGGGDGTTSAGGMPGAALALPETLRGGCRGQDGGAGTSNPGQKGNGGGAVYVVAKTKIQLDGKINASGAGASGGQSSQAGGGGGGAGGMIVVSAAMVVGNGVLMANGGGGGAGFGNSVGNAGKDPDFADATANAAGGGGAAGGGTGGVGAAQSGAGAGTNSGASKGGGGGGGGAGLIYAPAVGGATVSPVPKNLP